MGKFKGFLLEEKQYEKWDSLVSRYGSVFHSIRWTSIFEPNIRRVGIFDKGENLKGGFCYFEGRRMGLKVLRNPPFTPDIGPFYEKQAANPAAVTNEQRHVVEAMVQHIESLRPALVSLSLSPDIVDGIPFYWKGYKVIASYTYSISLEDNEDRINGFMSPERRNDIKKAVKDGLEANEEFDRDILKKLVLKTFQRQNKKFPKSDMDAVLETFLPGENAYLFVTRSKGHPIAAVYCVHDTKTAYSIMTGYDDERAHHGAGALAIYQAILKAKELGLKVFDFEGSVVPPIEKYYRGFGGELTSYHRVNKAWPPIEMILKPWKRQLF